MTLKYIAVASALATCMTLFPAISTAKTMPVTKSDKAQFKELSKDATIVGVFAKDINKMTEKASTNWKTYDLRWNEIKPQVEDMNQCIAALQAHRTSLTPDQQKALSSAQSLVSDLASNTTQFHNYLSQHNTNISPAHLQTISQKFTQDAQQLKQDAKKS